MARAFRRWTARSGGTGRPRRNRAIGCLLWLIAAIVILIIVSLVFGGFQKGTKAAGQGGGIRGGIGAGADAGIGGAGSPALSPAHGAGTKQGPDLPVRPLLTTN
jgi:hypothetical protein